MDAILRVLSQTSDGGAWGVELLVLMVPALVVIGRSCRQLRQRPPSR